MQPSRRLTVPGSYIRVVGCPGLSESEAHELIQAAIGLALPDDHLALESQGFLVALPNDAVGFLLERSLQALKNEGTQALRVRFRDPDALAKMKTRKREAFTPPESWLQES